MIKLFDKFKSGLSEMWKSGKDNKEVRTVETHVGIRMVPVNSGQTVLPPDVGMIKVAEYLRHCLLEVSKSGLTDSVTTLETLKGVKISEGTLYWFNNWVSSLDEFIKVGGKRGFGTLPVTNKVVRTLLGLFNEYKTLGSEVSKEDKALHYERLYLLSAIFDCRIDGYWREHKSDLPESLINSRLEDYVFKSVFAKVKEVVPIVHETKISGEPQIRRWDSKELSAIVNFLRLRNGGNFGSLVTTEIRKRGTLAVLESVFEPTNPLAQKMSAPLRRLGSGMVVAQETVRSTGLLNSEPRELPQSRMEFQLELYVLANNHLYTSNGTVDRLARTQFLKAVEGYIERVYKMLNKTDMMNATNSIRGVTKLSEALFNKDFIELYKKDMSLEVYKDVCRQEVNREIMAVSSSMVK